MSQKNTRFFRVPRQFSPVDNFLECSDSEAEEPKQNVQTPKWITQEKDKMMPGTPQIHDPRYMPQTRYVYADQFPYAAVPRAALARHLPTALPARTQYYTPNLMPQFIPAPVYKALPNSTQKVPYILPSTLPILEKTPNKATFLKHSVPATTPRYKRTATRLTKRPSLVCQRKSCRPDQALMTPRRTTQAALADEQTSLETTENIRDFNPHTHIHPQSAPITRVQTPNPPNISNGERLQRLKDAFIAQSSRDKHEYAVEVDLISCDENMSEGEDEDLEKQQDSENEEIPAESYIGETKQETNETIEKDEDNINLLPTLSLTKILKPRLPPSLKSVRNSSRNSSVAGSVRETNPTEKSRSKTDNEVLEKVTNDILNDMFKEMTIETPRKETNISHRENDEKANSDHCETNSDIFDNNEEFSLQLQAEIAQVHELSKNPDSRRKSVWTRTTGTKQLTGRESVHEPAPTDVNQSVKYVVQLIDRALSRELGAVPEQVQKTPRPRAVGPVPASIDLRSRRNDSNTTTESVTPFQQDLTKQNYSQISGHNTDTEYPPAAEVESIVHMKKLRWHYLKQIQREVKQLENVERFLDCYSADKEDN